MELNARWEIGSDFAADRPGFGRLINVTSSADEAAVAKLIPKDPGAQRELLFGETDAVRGARNVVPVLDTGEHGNDWVIVMPKAERSLRQHLVAAGGPLEINEAVEILRDIATALVDLSGHVVHRDLKPENVLRLGDRWCVADFGISRYAEATTAADTRKRAMTPPYAAPEQWLLKRATSATDVYALGAIGYEILSGHRLFDGPDFAEQHLHEVPAALTAGTRRLRVLVEECLFKAPEARPTPENVLAKLAAAQDEPNRPGASRLADANRLEVEKRAADHAQMQSETSESRRRSALFDVATMSYESIAEQLLDVIKADAPTARLEQHAGRGGMLWVADLRYGRLGVANVLAVDTDKWSGPFDVIATAQLTVNCQSNTFGYRGRSHSLWYCDAEVQGAYAWYELAFMDSPFASQPDVVPYAAEPWSGSVAFSNVMGTKQLAWPLEKLDRADLEEFVDRWIGWFGAAANRELQRPNRLPERDVPSNWRRTS